MNTLYLSKVRTFIKLTAFIIVTIVSMNACNSPSSILSEKQHFDESNWSLLESDANKYKGSTVEVVGRLFLPPEKTEEGYAWQMDTDPLGGAWNTLVYYSRQDIFVEEGSFVLVKGSVRGSFTGTNGFGAELTLPVIDATEVTIVDVFSAAPSALYVREVQQTQDQHGLAVTLERIEFASSETRFFVRINNNTENEASFYEFDMKIIQGSQQFESEYTSYYPEVQNTILPGVESSGVVLFDKLSNEVPIQVFIEAQTDNYDLDFEAYIFDIQP